MKMHWCHVQNGLLALIDGNNAGYLYWSIILVAFAIVRARTLFSDVRLTLVVLNTCSIQGTKTLQGGVQTFATPMRLNGAEVWDESDTGRTCRTKPMVLIRLWMGRHGARGVRNVRFLFSLFKRTPSLNAAGLK